MSIQVLHVPVLIHIGIKKQSAGKVEKEIRPSENTKLAKTVRNKILSYLQEKQSVNF